VPIRVTMVDAASAFFCLAPSLGFAAGKPVLKAGDARFKRRNFTRMK